MYVYSIWLVDPLSVKPGEVDVLFPIWTMKHGKMVDCWAVSYTHLTLPTICSV